MEKAVILGGARNAGSRHVARILALGGLSPLAVWTGPPSNRPTPKFFRLRRAIVTVRRFVTVTGFCRRLPEYIYILYCCK